MQRFKTIGALSRRQERRSKGGKNAGKKGGKKGASKFRCALIFTIFFKGLYDKTVG
jgi:hypothetical protein